MAVVSMKKLHLCAMKHDRKAVLETLQSLGVVEICLDEVEDENFKKMNTVTPRNQLDKHVQNTDNALEILEKYVPEKKGLLASLEGKKDVAKASMDEVIEKHHAYNRTVYKILDIEHGINTCEANIAKSEVAIESLTPWIDMDIPINTVSTKYTKVFIGSLPPEYDEGAVYALIAERAPEVDSADVHIISRDKDQSCIVAVCLDKDADDMHDALRSGGFTRIATYSRKTPKEKIEQHKSFIVKDKEKIENLTKKLEKYDSDRDTLKLLSDYYTIRSEKYRVLGELLQTENTFMITGFIPEDKAESVEKRLNDNFNLYLEMTDVSDKDKVPVLLKNKSLFASAEGVLESFGLPGKGELDPTAPMSICYIILFGLMLSDAAYGLIVFIACLVLLKKFPKMGDALKKSISLFMYCGLSTLFWGVLFGGYFGDAISVITRVFFGKEVVVKPVWFAPLDNPMKMLLVSLAIGLVHLFFGLILKGVKCIKDKDFIGLISDVVSWLLLIAGLIMMLMPTSLFASIAGAQINFSEGLKTASYVITIAGALIILVMSGRDHKNPALRLALGLYDLYGLTSWLSDLLSYSRLLALGLATGVIAQVVNQMGSMLGASVPGVIVFILVFIIGHVFNMAINLLGAYVHTCRLQYVEFFGKFYEGGGERFTPFKEETKYVTVKKNIKL